MTDGDLDFHILRIPFGLHVYVWFMSLKTLCIVSDQTLRVLAQRGMLTNQSTNFTLLSQQLLQYTCRYRLIPP